MNFSSNKEKGNSGLGMAIAYFSTNGYVVSIPLNDTQDYDLVVEKENMLKKVQVKSTGCIEKGEHYQVSLKSCGGTKGLTYKTIINTSIDLLFILTEKKEMYLIPKGEIVKESASKINRMYRKRGTLSS